MQICYLICSLNITLGCHMRAATAHAWPPHRCAWCGCVHSATAARCPLSRCTPGTPAAPALFSSTATATQKFSACQSSKLSLHCQVEVALPDRFLQQHRRIQPRHMLAQHYPPGYMTVHSAVCRDTTAHAAETRCDTLCVSLF